MGRSIDAEDIPLGVLAVDAAWKILWANAAAAERLAQRADQLPGLACALLFERGEQVVERLRAALAAGGPALAPDVRARRDDREVWLDLAAHPQRSGALLTLVDASARAALRAELARLNDRLGESEREKEKIRRVQRELTDEAAQAPTMIGASEGMRRVIAQAERVAPTSATALIHGETGSGKDLVARTIHARSPRAAGAFIAVNCAALPESLIESELFGHERGAFTGAERQRLGKFELADGGTLFLDEVAELSAQAQAKLLRVLQNGAFERVGGAETVTVDVRVIAATHRELARQVERGRFREDLFYRLNVFRIDVPPLRDRREDLRALIEFLHERHARRMGRPALPVSERSMRRALAYRWPGNIRELENAVERATLLSEGAELELELPESPTPQMGAQAGPGAAGGSSPGGPGSEGGTSARDVLLDLTSEQLQRMQMMHALEACGYRVFGGKGAARRLGLNPQTMLSRMDKFGIPRPRVMRGGAD
ncbi:MAG: sigma-54-dependent Fis family transcriptional regulator [Phycisphaerales bacterium]|nr:sigma-54-dependent Fis family transcriptional regulator [Phycisphaerales bacterium]